MEDESQDPQKYSIEESKAMLLKDQEFISSIPKESLPEEWFDHTEATKAAVSEALSGHYGRANKTLRTAFAITDEKWDTIPEETRSDIYKLMPYVKENFGTKVEGEASEFIAKYQQMESKYNELNSSIPTQLEERESSIKELYEVKLFDMGLSTSISQFSKNFSASAEFITPSVMSKLKSKYDIKLEDGAYIFYNKGETTRALSSNEGSLHLKEAVKKQLGKDWVETQEETKIVTAIGEVTPNIKPSSGQRGIDSAYEAKLKREAEANS